MGFDDVPARPVAPDSGPLPLPGGSRGWGRGGIGLQGGPPWGLAGNTGPARDWHQQKGDRRNDPIPGGRLYSCPEGALAVSHCRFRTSNENTSCSDLTYLEGFCRFHYDALKRGEINELGVLNELLSDQVRRREINFHGISPKSTYVNE